MNLDQFTNQKTYSGLLSSITSGNAINVNVNGTSIPVMNKKIVSSVNDNAASLLKQGNQTVKVLDYYAPSKVVLDTFSELGKDIDKSLKSSFLLQTFHIKGTDVLCSMFCFMISLLSCSERTALANTISNINKGTQALTSGARGVKGMVDALGSTVNSATTIANNIGQIFNDPKSTSKNLLNSTQSAVAVLGAAPQSISNNAKLISNALRFGTNFKFMMPNFTGKGIWDLSQNVLFALQGMAVQTADEALRKIIKPVEDKLNEIWPSICYSSMADRVRCELIRTIETLKSRILNEIASLFQSNSGFNLGFRLVNKTAGWALELVAFMNALDYLSANFLEIAKGCGVTPCSAPPKLDLTPASQIGNIDVAYADTVNPFEVTYKKTSPTIARIPKTIPAKNTNSMDKVADKFKDFMSPNNIHIDDNSIKSTYNLNNNAPQQIKDFIAQGLLNNILDSNYTIDPDTATVVYNYDKKCNQ